MKNLVTLKQAIQLQDLGFYGPTMRYAYRMAIDEEYHLEPQKGILKISCKQKGKSLMLCVPTVDEAIDFLRRKHNVIIYNRVEPYVDTQQKAICYSYAIKHCNKIWGWNQRIYVGCSQTNSNPYTAKREAIKIAIDYINRKNNKNGYSKKR